MSEVLLHTKLRELEDELKGEREYRIRYEKEVSKLRIDLDDLEVQLDEANNIKERESEAGKRLRQELADLKQKIDHQTSETEESSALIRRKHQETITELSNHLEALNKSKLKYEKDSKQFLHQVEELKHENESLAKAKLNALNLCRDLENKQIESAQRIDELLKQLSEINDVKTKLTNQNTDYYRRNASIEFELQQFSLSNKRLNQEIDDARMQLENEMLVKNTLENKYRSLQADFDTASAHLEEASETRLELTKQMSRMQEEFKVNKEKVEKECNAKIDEFEDSKRRLNNRFVELQEQYSDLLTKNAATEKLKKNLQTQLETNTADLEKFKKKSDDLSKREKILEKELEDFKTKLNIANTDLDAAYISNRNYSTELSKFKHLSDHLSEQLESVSKEKRKLSEEYESTSNQLLESSSKLTELERKVKSIDADRQQLQNELDDSKDSLHAEINRNQNLQAQYERLKLESDKRIADKDDEIDSYRASTRRQLEGLQAQLEEAESRHKLELVSMKKKFTAELDELKTTLETTKKSKNDAENNLKKQQQTNKELMDKLNEEQHMHDTTRDQLMAAEKKASTHRAELEETKSLYDRVDKSKKILDSEFHELEIKHNEIQSALNRANSERKKFEADATSASDELQEAKFELRNAEDKLRTLNSVLLKTEEELRNEKELAAEYEASKKSIEQQLRETQARVDEAEEFARREAKRLSNKLETRLIQLEQELDLEKQKEQEFIKELRRLEKRNKDLVDQVNDDHNKLIALNDAYDKLQDKAKKYKAQIDGAEEQVAVNASKCKRLQRDLEDAEDRAENIAKTFMRASSISRDRAVAETYDSDYDSEQYSNNASTIMRSSYLYSKSANTDEYSPSAPLAGESTKSMANMSARHVSNSIRSRLKSLDIDDDDITIQPRYTHKYYGSSTASLANQLRNKTWSYNRNDRARSVASGYDGYETKIPPTILIGMNRRSINYNTLSRRSVGRSIIDDDLNDSTATLVDSYNSSKLNRSNASKLLEKYSTRKSPERASSQKRSEIEKRISLGPETSVTPTPENLD